MSRGESFSQRHPFLFGLTLILLAVVLFVGAAAFLRSSSGMGGVLGEPRLGLVRVEGSIDDSVRIVEWIEELRSRDSVKGVLVRIDSPGGMVAPSQEIHAAVQRVRKPVVVSMGQAATSGGYYVACAADKIVANPGTITGSIGVRADLVNIRELMGKAGVSREIIVSGEYKDAGDPSQPLTDKERRYFQKLVDDLFEQFVEAVAQGRGMEPEKVRQFSDGRAFTGRQAHEKGLVDSLGGRMKAKDMLKRRSGLTGSVPFLEGPEKQTSLLELLLNWLGFSWMEEAANQNKDWVVRY